MSCEKQQQLLLLLTDEQLTEFIRGTLGFPNLASKGTLGLEGSVEATICKKSLITNK